MKILKVEFENINSLKGSHTIDFSEEPFVTNSLFAITGPTGSGKSSILDVISLALFCKIPRLPGNRTISKADINKYGAIITRNQKNSMARVTYESKNRKFSSQWSIEVNRNDNLNDFHMELYDHSSEKLVPLKKSEVPGKNEELIGLNYDQFIKAVLLAQGEFAQFLKAKKEERGELLEKITGTGIYRRLGIKAYEKKQEANKEIQDQQNEIAIIQRDLLKEEEFAAYNKDLQEKTRQCKTQQKEINTIEKGLDIKKSIKDLNKQTDEIKLVEDQALKKLKIFEAEHGAALTVHEKVQPEAEKLRTWNQLKKDILDAENDQRSVQSQLDENKRQREKILEDTSAFIGEKTDNKNILEKLNDFREKVQKLQEVRTIKINAYHSKKEQLRSELRDTGISIRENDLEQFLLDLRSEYTSTETEIKKLIQKLDFNEGSDLQAERLKFRSKLTDCKNAYRKYDIIEGHQKEISRIEEELRKAELPLKELPKKISALQENTLRLKEKLENRKLKKENLALRASLDEHRKNLKDGEPCPLCGAIHHPYSSESDVETNELDTEISQLTSKHENSQRELHQLEAEYRTLEGARKQNSISLLDHKNTFSESLKRFSEEHPDFGEVKAKKEIEDISDKLEEKIEELNKLEKFKQQFTAISNSVPLTKELIEIVQKGKELKQQLEALYTGKNIQQDVQEFSNSWITAEEEKRGILTRSKEIEEDIKKNLLDLKQLENDLDRFLKLSNFPNIQEAWKALLSESEAAELREQKQEISDELKQAQASEKTLNAQLEKWKELDSETDEEQLKEELEQKKEQLSQISTQCKEIERLIRNYQEKMDRMQALQLEIAEKEKQSKRWRLLNELIGDAKGKAFNDFAQDLTLTRLLKLANKRLQELSDRYLIDKPDPDEDDGLVAIDEHMGGQRRSVKTLSGGETFILSLSMALALSDLASKNVDINSLFIDEGFGTLDPETLDQTLDTLEKLQAESSKTIGVISHVESLKERITTQIQLRRNGQGYSSLTIK